ncbi:MAG: hypothetical protein OXC44_02825 [Proteobacteria bacterium]|nr:hypothetical protein [Pseudomonadota bacterium]
MNLANYLKNKSFILRSSNSDRYTYIFVTLSIMTIIVSCTNDKNKKDGGVMGGTDFAGLPTLVLSSGGDADAEAKAKKDAKKTADAIEDLELDSPPPKSSSSNKEPTSETDDDSETDGSSETSDNTQPEETQSNGCITPTDKTFKALFMLEKGTFVFNGFGNASNCTNHYSSVTISIYTPNKSLYKKAWNIVLFYPETIHEESYKKPELSSLFWFYDMRPAIKLDPNSFRTKPEGSFEALLKEAVNNRDHADRIKFIFRFFKRVQDKPKYVKHFFLNNQETRVLSKLAGYDVFGNPTPVKNLTSEGSSYYTLTDETDLNLLKKIAIKIILALDKDGEPFKLP